MGAINVIHPTATGSALTQTSIPFPSKPPPVQFSLPRPSPPVTVHDLFSSLRLSASRSRIDLARAAHAVFLKLFHDNNPLGTSVISTYLELGRPRDARQVFDSLPSPDVVSYSALISGLAKSGLEDEAVELFGTMMRSGVEPNGYSFVAVLTACMRLLDAELGSQVHGLCVKLGFAESVFVCNALMGLYGKCGCVDYVVQMFDEMPQRDVSSWNTLTSSLVQWDCCERGLEALREMGGVRGFGIGVDQVTLSTGLTACSGCRAVMLGREIHARAIRTGLDAALSVGNVLIGFYTGYGSLREVEAVFERMKVRNVITWTEMLNGYMEFGMADEAVELFDRMPERNCISYDSLLAGLCQNGRVSKVLDLFLQMIIDGRELTEFTLTSVIKACGMAGMLELNRQVHGFVTKSGIGPNACIGAALIDMCTRCGRMTDAEKLLKSWPFEQAGSIIRTSILCGYARNGLSDEAVSFFVRCYLDGTLVMDEVAFASALGVCGTLGIDKVGMQIHSHAIKTGYAADVGVGNSLVSMYSKCCSMEKAITSFDTMPTRDIVSWNCLIAGHVLHRQGDEALSVWSNMKKAGIRPDSITFVLTLSSYRHTSSNLVNQCRNLFDSMERLHGVDPNSEHYASLVGVLGFWGLLKEAEEIIIGMPFEPDAAVWRALLDCCRLHMDMVMGKRIVKRILAMKPKHPSTYVLMSNLYSASGLWHMSDMTRESMKEKRLQKHPCRSWIFNHNNVHSFYVRDKSHPEERDIYGGLDVLIMECLKAGYQPDTSFVLHELEEHQKKDFLFYHSAKLAATYGLLSTKPGETIRIVKNILLCGDCHSFLKHVSTVTRREIVVRDTSGFHCFSNGKCSCRDHR